MKSVCGCAQLPYLEWYVVNGLGNLEESSKLCNRCGCAYTFLGAIMLYYLKSFQSPTLIQNEHFICISFNFVQIFIQIHAKYMYLQIYCNIFQIESQKSVFLK